jgi:hypothetical protein
MPSCGICDGPIQGPNLTDAKSGLDFHPGCVAERLPQDAIIALIGALALVLTPTVLVWAA